METIVLLRLKHFSKLIVCETGVDTRNSKMMISIMSFLYGSLRNSQASSNHMLSCVCEHTHSLKPKQESRRQCKHEEDGQEGLPAVIPTLEPQGGKAVWNHVRRDAHSTRQTVSAAQEMSVSSFFFSDELHFIHKLHYS